MTRHRGRLEGIWRSRVRGVGTRAPGVVIAALLTCAGALHAQPPIFHNGVDVVMVTVTVQRADGSYVTGLDQRQFVVADEGVPQNIAFFSAKSVPIDLLLILDVSESMVDRLASAEEAAANFVRALGPGDRAALVTVAGHPEMRAGFSADHRSVVRALTTLHASGLTRLYEGLYVALRSFPPPEPGEYRRRAIVILSDGEDNGSLLSYNDVLTLVRQSGIAVYAISMGKLNQTAANPMRFSEPEFNLRQIATDSGGRAYAPTEMEQISTVYGSIARELSSQYALAFVTQATAGPPRFRRLSIAVDVPHVTVRARSGYVPGRSSSAEVR